MRIALSTNQYFDDTGFPLAAGKVSVYLHDSDTHATLYTLEGDVYTEADNPFICGEDGRFPTMYFDVGVVDVMLEKPNGDGTYELIDTFQDGFEMPSGKSDTVAQDIDSLKGISPSVGSVTVVGYSSEVMAPPRTYVWDPSCTLTPDDGVIVASDTTETGRWLLVWDDEKLPCTVYGIVPGRESNISAFLTFPETVGQWNIRTPRICRFVGGNYTSSTTYSTTKKLYFDSNAKFTNAIFNCPSARVELGNTSFIADMHFSDAMTEANLSWFRTRTAFRDCGAKVINIDADYTASGSNVTLSNKIVHQFTALPSWLTLDNVIVSRPDDGTLSADTVHATDLLKVGNLFRIVPHEEAGLTTKYYDVYSLGNDNYPTMRLDDAQNVTFMNGIDVRAGISIPRTGYPQQWWGYFDGSDAPQIQIDAEGSIDVTGHVNASTARYSSSLTLGSGAHFFPGKFLDINMTGYIDENTDVNLPDWVLNKNELAYIRVRLSLSRHDPDSTNVDGTTRYNVKLYNGTYMRFFAWASANVTHQFFLVPVMVCDSGNLPYIFSPVPYFQEFPTDGNQWPKDNYFGYFGWFNGVQPI